MVANCIIFSAGIGSRMGEVGKIIPKPLWPLFEANLLTVQIQFALSLGCQTIYINTHHLHQKIAKGIPSRYLRHIVFVFEKELLGCGGTLHHIVQKFSLKKDFLLTMNADAFLIPQNQEFLHHALAKISSSNRGLLFAVTTPKEGRYRELIVDKNRLVGIGSNAFAGKSLIYSGVGLFNLAGLSSTVWKNNFFDSIVNFSEESVLVEHLKAVEFWDFGMRKLYAQNIYQIVEMINQKKQSAFIDFLVKNRFLNEQDVGVKSYRSSRPGVINFTSKKSLKNKTGQIEEGIILETGKSQAIITQGE